jgi:hypothetical protein
MCEHGQESVVKLPPLVDKGKENRTVSIDSCILLNMRYLWENAVDTCGCCCGHGQNNPSIILPEEYNKSQIKRVAKLLATCDKGEGVKRTWDIYQWQLVKVV